MDRTYGTAVGGSGLGRFNPVTLILLVAVFKERLRGAWSARRVGAARTLVMGDRNDRRISGQMRFDAYTACIFTQESNRPCP
jgi:hypothetical protein